MPNIEIRDYMGKSRQISSSNPQTIASWLIEQCGELVNVNQSLGPVQVYIYPRFIRPADGGRDVPDWKPGSLNLAYAQFDIYAIRDICSQLLAAFGQTGGVLNPDDQVK